MAASLLNYYWFVSIMIGWPSMASGASRPNCQDSCGSLTIPYPFGIGNPDCFLDPWFEISCHNNSTTLLTRTKLQVLNFSLSDNGEKPLSQWALIRNPISFFDCINKTSRAPANLTGTPFFYTSSNEFLAVSCGERAKLETKTGNRFYGCASADDPTYCSGLISSIDFRNCDSIKCCTTTSFNSSIGGSFEISMDNSTLTTTTDNGRCKYAFLMDSSSLSGDVVFGDDDEEYVPVQISWRLNNTLRDILKSDVMPNNSTTVCKTISSSTDRLYSCQCQSGFRGNPYLPEGCQDIDECKENPRRCRKGTYCVNTIGKYDCKVKNRRLKDSLAGFAVGVGVIGQIFGAWRLYKFLKKIKQIKLRDSFFKQNGGSFLEEFNGEASNLDNQDININDGAQDFEDNINDDDNQDDNKADNQDNKARDHKVKLFGIDEIEKITDNFSSGRTVGQDNVYKGMLEDGTIVVVRKFKRRDEAELDEFTHELIVLTQINHPNIVKLLGCCLESDVPFVVYEFIPNGTLSDLIHDNKEFIFTWNMRLRVAIDVATALSYLHSKTPQPIHHWDVRSTNILLDEKFRAKLANVRISKSLEQPSPDFDTFAYRDPECSEFSQLTDKSDVYSFGVVLVELLTRQKAITRFEEERILAAHFKMEMKRKGSHFDIIDGDVSKTAEKDEISKVARLAERCLHSSGSGRPTMKQVVMELRRIKANDKDFKGVQPNDQVSKYDQLENVDNVVNKASTSLEGSNIDFSDFTS